MRNWDSCVSACKGLLFFFFSFVEEKTQQPISNCCCERKKKREGERKRGEVKQRRKSLASLTKTLSPSVLCLPSSLKATKRFESGRRRRRRRRRSSSSSSWRRKNEGTRSKTSDRGRLSRSSRRAGLCPKTRSRRSARCRPR